MQEIVIIHMTDIVKGKKMGTPWGCSSVGRAPALQAGGHGFESHHLHPEAGQPGTGYLKLGGGDITRNAK